MFCRQEHREFRVQNNILKAFVGGKPKSWVLSENAVQVLGGATLPPTIRQQYRPLALCDTPKNPPAPTQEDQGPKQSPSVIRRLPSLETEKEVAGTAEGVYKMKASSDSTEVSPQPATDKDAGFGPIRQGSPQDQPVDLNTGSGNGAGVGHTLPSPAPGNSPPGPEHQQPLVTTVLRVAEKPNPRGSNDTIAAPAGGGRGERGDGMGAPGAVGAGRREQGRGGGVRDGRTFLLFILWIGLFSFVIYFGTHFILLGQAWAEGKGEHATGRYRADC